MRLARGTWSAAIALAVLGCVTPPPPEDSSSAVVAVRLNAKAPFAMLSWPVDRVLFVKIDEGEDDSLLQTETYFSNHADDGYFYLLNAPPGRYVAVAAFHTSVRASPRTRLTADVGSGGDVEFKDVPAAPHVYETGDSLYFPESFVRTREVAVEPGSIAFMGEFLVHTSLGLEGADEVQSYYFRLLQPGQSENAYVQAVLHGSRLVLGHLEEGRQDREALERFSRKAAEHLEGAGWGSILRGLDGW